MKSVHAMLAFLQARRAELARSMGNRRIGMAACDVLDALIARTGALAARMPADAPMTLSYLENEVGEGIELMGHFAEVLKALAGLMQECENTVYAQRQRFATLVGRIEAEGYRVDNDTFFTVRDGWDWSKAETASDPAVRVQLEAERIARVEQAAIYQKRLQRMDAAILRIEDGYAQRVRELAGAGE
jgi:hypothetical protein